MEEPNVNEREQTMLFLIGTIVVQGISEGTHKQILGQVMDFNCLTWIFSLVLV